MELIDVMRTARAIRRYRPDPVPDELILSCIEAATFAPSGSNQQDWRFLILRSPQVRALLGKAYRQGWDEYATQMELQLPEASDLSRRARFIRSMDHFAHQVDAAPAYVMFCLKHQPYIGDFHTGASIYPAVQNFMLAAREQGLGTVFTTWYTREEDGLRNCVQVPDDWRIAAILPLGYPQGSHGPVRRRPVRDVVAWDSWQGTAP